MLQDKRAQAVSQIHRVLRPGGIFGVGEPILNRTLTDDDAIALYGPDDPCQFRQCFRTIEWTADLLRNSGFEVLSARPHAQAKQMWADFYGPWLDRDGRAKEARRQPEIDIWRRDDGQFHGIGTVVARRL